MLIGVPQEKEPGEKRVALVPDALGRLEKGVEVLVEQGAGNGSLFSDDSYRLAGARIGSRAESLMADVVLCVRSPVDVATLRPGTVLIGFLQPLEQPEEIKRIAALGVSAIAVELIPRITRAQSMDALSSQATIAGYVAAVMVAGHLPRFLPMLTTAAGTVPPAKVLVLGAGVAGLQAIATARRLGALVSGFDTRAAAWEQIKSLGAKVLDLGVGGVDAEVAGGYARALTDEEAAQQQERLTAAIPEFDAVITTALVPGRPAPKLIPAAAVEAMRAGSVIVDLAAERGGNCDLTRAGEVVVSNGITIIGDTNLPSHLPVHASQLYSRNLVTLLDEMIVDGNVVVDLENEIISGACVCHQGKVLRSA